MIKDNQKALNRLHVLLDALTIVISYVAAWYLHFRVLHHYGPESGVFVLPIGMYMRVLVFIVPLFLILYYYGNVYVPQRTGALTHEIYTVVRANAIGSLLYILVFFYILKQTNYSRKMFVLFVALNVFLTCLIRFAIRYFLRKVRSRGRNLKHVLIAGYSRATEEYITRIQENPQWGYSIHGILDNTVPQGTLYKKIPVIGTLEELREIIETNSFDEIAVALSLKDYERLEEIVNICEKTGVHTKFVPDYNSVIPTKPYTEDLLGLPVINIRNVPLSNSFNRFWKRLMDIAAALLAIIITSPLMLIIAILVKTTSKGPVIFKQERVGLHGKTFYMYKFRSMRPQLSSEEKKGWTTKDDPRVTPVGRFIRKTSIDELPQMFNILKGDMSLIGPRPERPQYVEKFKEEIPRYMVKHQVRPGLTGWAQVNGYRGDTSIKRRIEYDIYYIENWSIIFDLKIVLMTFFTGFINKNAY